MEELLVPKEKIVLVAFGGEEAKEIGVEEFQKQFCKAKTKSAQLAACLRVLSTWGYCSKLKHVPEFWDKRREYSGQ